MTTVVGTTFPVRAPRAKTYRLVAVDTTASITPGQTPAVVIWPTVSVADSAYTVADGVITFTEACQFNSTFFVTLSATSDGPLYYTDAEISTDGGTTWVRGANSLRQWQIRNTDGAQTISFPFNGGFAAGTKLRFVDWTSANTARLTTTTTNGSTSPARRITYNRTPCALG